MSALDRVRSIKTKLGLLVLVSVLVTALVASVGSGGGVPWWLTLPVTVGLALTVTQLLAAGMVAPLREMTAAATSMSRGRYDVRVLTDNTDEVGELARAFNRMATDLQQVDSERRDLIATVSHELRTPVTAMTAQLENLADGVVAASPERLAQVLDSAERLGGLVTDLLTLSRLEAGVVELDRGPVTLRGLVDECVADVRRAGRDAEIEVEVADDLVVEADAPRLRQLVVNVLDNAARHAPEGTAVVVRAGEGPSGWWLEVLDAGPGVAPEDRERVFERFGTDAEGGGTGLGLAIARWVAALHGGRLDFVDPQEGAQGARLRLDVPPVGVSVDRGGDVAPARTGTVVDPSGSQPRWSVDLWPEDRPEPDVRPVLGAMAVGVLAGALMTFTGLGLAWTAVFVLAGVVAWSSSVRPRDPYVLLASGLAVGLVGCVAIRDNDVLVILGVLFAAGTFLAGVTAARTFRGMVLSGLAWPLSGARGLAWLGRSLGVVGTVGRAPAAVRTTVASAVVLVVFGALFASADRTFARWVGVLVPQWRADEVVARVFVAVGVFGLTLAAAYLARNPARVDPFAPPVPAAANRWEWLVPLAVVDTVFLVFLASQVRVVVGGHEYVSRVSGLSYAEYVHQGFAQLVVATVLTLVVLWAASRRAGRTGTDRRWFLGAAGLLCLLALGVVATALARMGVYQDAYGFTTLRVTVTVFEAWLGLVVLAVMVLGARGWGHRVPRLALLSGAGVFLVLLLVNPDGFVAGRNIDRYEATGRLDTDYLATLSKDAAPVVLERLPREVAVCVLPQADWGWWDPVDGYRDSDRSGWDWTWSYARARVAVEEFLSADAAVDGATDCSPPLD